MHDTTALRQLDCRPIAERILGPALKHQGGSLRFLCPFHTSSGQGANFAVWATGFKCHSHHCVAGAGAISLVMALLQMDFKSACQYLGGETKEVQSRPLTPRVVTKNTPDPLALHDIWQRSIDKLWSSDQRGLDYLLGRGLTPETIQWAKLGYIPHTGRVYQVHGLTVHAGIVIPSTWQGQVEGLKFRSIVSQQPHERYRSLGDFSQALFWADQSDPWQPLLVFEGQFNALIAHQLGFQAVATQSASSLIAQRWWPHLLTHPLILVCGDADAAGQAFQQSHRQLGPRFKVWEAPAMDLNDLYRHDPDQAQALLQRWLTAHQTYSDNLLAFAVAHFGATIH
jgi:DNA primase